MQWFVFVVSGSLSFIIVAASLLDLQGAARARFMTSVLIVLAVTTLVQAAVGHRLPLFEGPSTPYVAMLVVLVQGAPVTPALRAQLAGALVLAGLVVGAVGWFAGRALVRLLSPYVVGSFLFLLGLTLLLRLAPQALGHTATRLVEPAAGFALLAVLASSLLVYRAGPPLLRALIFLSGYLAGLTAYLLAGGPLDATAASSAIFVVPRLGPLAVPAPTLLIVVVLTMLIPMINVYASIEAVAAAMPVRERVDLRGATALYGAAQVLAGLVGSVGTVPRSESSGLVAASGAVSRQPLVIAALALVGVALLGPAVAVLASFPVAVAIDVLMVAAAFVALIARRLYARVRWSRPRAAATLAALALCLALTVVSTGWGAVSVFLSNPILPGTLLAIAIDQAGRAGPSRQPA
ncbi:MAG TPA: solute carrier family 23 protein [Candidatus Limnocylindrales bacterium]|nr:solute carrier family 23 protein [Candidatus Limnocylindrales bacterium]